MNEMHAPICAFALKDSDRKSLCRSSSGGAFAVFARACLAQGGIVYGASMHKDGIVRQTRVENLRDLALLQGSKYVRSEIEGSFSDCIDDLHAGKEVLYSGLPCQISALRAVVNRSGLTDEEKRHLLCVDLICHGAPEQKVFTAYLSWLSGKMHADDGIDSFLFRTKEYGWGASFYRYSYEKDGVSKSCSGSAGDDPYCFAFSRGVINHPGCYKCPFARKERIGDITIGDYWGIRRKMPDFYDSMGVSAVLVNSREGRDFFFDRCASQCDWRESTFEDIAEFQVNLSGPTNRTDSDRQIYRDVIESINAGDYTTAFEKLLPIDNSRSAKIRRLLPRSVLRLLYGLKNGR